MCSQWKQRGDHSDCRSTHRRPEINFSQLPGERLKQRPMRVANTVCIKVLNVLLIYIQAVQITAHIPEQSYYYDGYHVATWTLILFFQSSFITTLIIQSDKSIYSFAQIRITSTSTSLCNHCNFDCKQIVLEVKWTSGTLKVQGSWAAFTLKGLVLEFLHIRSAFFVLSKCTGKIVQYRSSDIQLYRGGCCNC